LSRLSWCFGGQLLGGAALQRCDQLVIDEGFSPSLSEEILWKVYPASSPSP
jgi:hypothetical protein